MVFALDWDGPTHFVAALGALVVAGAPLFMLGLSILWWRMKQLAERVDNQTKRNIRQGQTGLRVARRLHGQNGDLISAEIREAFAPITMALQVCWSYSQRKKETEVQFYERLDHEFGPWLARFLCPALEINNGECLAMASIIAREPPPDPKPPSSDPQRSEPGR